MVHLTFSNTPNLYYGYGSGVNAANLTSKDIQAANARLAPLRQQRISNSILKPTCHDAGYQSPWVKDNNTTGIDYTKCTKMELVKFLTDRRLKTMSATEKMNKHEMVAALRKADKKPLFENFTELPPELRNIIYDYTFTDPGGKSKPRVRPVTPALCRTNSQIRTESVPIFFRKTFQTIVVRSVRARPQAQQRRTKLHIGRIDDKYLHYFDFAEKMDWIRHFRCFNFRIERHTYDRHHDKQTFTSERYMVKFSDGMRVTKSWAPEKKDREGVKLISAGMGKVADHAGRNMSGDNFFELLEFLMESAETVYL